MVARQPHKLKVTGSSPVPATKQDQRSAKARQHRRLYNGKRWQALRDRQLSIEPLCRFCLITEEVTAATVVDHIRKHNGDPDLFFDPSNLQSLCKHHHDSAKQMIDHGHKVVTYGNDGYPIELM